MKGAMSMNDPFDFTLRYQRTPCARAHVRPLSLLQQDVFVSLQWRRDHR